MRDALNTLLDGGNGRVMLSVAKDVIRPLLGCSTADLNREALVLKLQMVPWMNVPVAPERMWVRK